MVVTYQWHNVPPGRQDRQTSARSVVFFFNLKFVKYFSVFLRVLNQTMMSSYLDQGKGLEKLECPGYTSVQTLVCSLLDVEAEHRHGQDQPPAGKHRRLLQ